MMPHNDILRAIANDANARFIEQHAADDVGALALQQAQRKDIDLSFCLTQIAGRQQARNKLPTWAAQRQLLFPPRLNVEQCSSETTARYKAELFTNLAHTALNNTTHLQLVDATGGFGVDFVNIATALQADNSLPTMTAHYADTDDTLCALARHNFPLLGVDNAVIHHDDGIEVLRQVSREALQQGHGVMLMIDPSRRDDHGQRTYDIAQCTPDVEQLHDELCALAPCSIIKLSPMVDWHDAVNRLPATKQVHIISTKNECKELLVVLLPHSQQPLTIHTINDEQHFVYTPDEKQRPTPSATIPLIASLQALAQACQTQKVFLYEPNASVMKAGCYDEVAQHYGITPLATMSHLFVADHDIPHFVGRRFVIDNVLPTNRKTLRRALQGIQQANVFDKPNEQNEACFNSAMARTEGRWRESGKAKRRPQANVAVRHFPMTANQLQQRMGVNDGGDIYIFGTTLPDNDHIVIVARKA